MDKCVTIVCPEIAILVFNNGAVSLNQTIATSAIPWPCSTR